MRNYFQSVGLLIALSCLAAAGLDAQGVDVSGVSVGAERGDIVSTDDLIKQFGLDVATAIRVHGLLHEQEAKRRTIAATADAPSRVTQASAWEDETSLKLSGELSSQKLNALERRIARQLRLDEIRKEAADSGRLGQAPP